MGSQMANTPKSKLVAQVFRAAALSGVAIAALTFMAAASAAHDYPSKPVKFIVPLAAAGPPDVMARLSAPALSARIGQPVIVENRPGGGGTIGTREVARAAPDGYTLLFAGANHTLGPALIKNLGYDPIADFAPIATFGSGSFILVVSPSLPVRSVQDLVDYAKANPGKINWGFGVGAGPVLLGEMFVSATGINVTRVTYKGGAQAIGDMLGGHIHMSFGTTATALPLIQDGKLRPLVVTSATRSLDLPDVPTMTEIGLPGLTRGFWTGLLGPARTPAVIVNRLHAEINASLATAEMQASLAKVGFEPKVGSPNDFAAQLAEEIETWKAAARVAGIEPQ
jgi:tripartite-type tricarboxylate transporter receptor subunit TctC